MDKRVTASRRKKTAAKDLGLEAVRELALALPGVEEGTSYGTPAFRVASKLLARLREDGETLVLKTDFDARETLMGADPQTFFLTDHYRNYPMVLVRLAAIGREDLGGLLEEAWRQSASKRLLAGFDGDKRA